MNIERIQTVGQWLINISSHPNWTAMFIDSQSIVNIRNGLTLISQDIEKEYPFFSSELFTKKDSLFIGYNMVNPEVFGEILEILRFLKQVHPEQRETMWHYIHPQISKVSQSLFEDGHYANAAEDAFIEINDRVKKIFILVNPNAAKIPDGQAAMTTVFSDNNPLVEFCDRSTDTGANTQKGFMQMLIGAMSALRNPKAHANIEISKADATRQLMFASMLMYKIDEAVKYSEIDE